MGRYGCQNNSELSAVFAAGIIWVNIASYPFLKYCFVELQELDYEILSCQIVYGSIPY